MIWPDDADGDVFRKLEAAGFDFQTACFIDFNVDFSSWPPSSDAMMALEGRFFRTTVHEPLDDRDGYVRIQIFDRLSYGLVVAIQSEISDRLAPYGGVCESWGVLH